MKKQTKFFDPIFDADHLLIWCSSHLENYTKPFLYDRSKNKFTMSNNIGLSPDERLTNDEILYLLEYLEQIELLELKPNFGGSDRSYTITPAGYKYINDLLKAGKLSKNCFVAMSFGEIHESLYTEVIKVVLDELNFIPLKVNESDTLKARDIDQTINDFIISSIKMSSFCIADFSGNKRGVYFEAGYAMGRGIPVIFTCNKEEFENTEKEIKIHFDVDRYPFIVYNDNADFKQKLMNAIRASIL